MQALRRLPVALGMVLVGALPAAAQTASKSAPPAASEPKLERESFLYPAGDRRDPFVSLAKGSLGPRFEELRLRGIIHSPDGGSVALLSDGGGRIFRVRRGELVGDSRVLSIEPEQVVFAVETFGTIRQERLVLRRRGKEGANQ